MPIPEINLWPHKAKEIKELVSKDLKQEKGKADHW